MRHRPPSSDLPIVSMGAIRRLVIRSLVAGTLFGIGLSSVVWAVFFFRECRT